MTTPTKQSAGDQRGPQASEPPPTVLLRVTSGDPTADEVAALVSVVGARLATSEAPTAVTPRSEWGAHTRKLRGIHRHSAGAWRSSAWPH